ncbi:LLM class flavin-dependent oxidoreductase [Mycolicibacterium sp. XJ870]
MRAGFYVPNFGCCGDARVLADLAHEAEDSGWDGLFLWDHLQVIEPTADPWIALAAMAMRTQRLRLGPLVTPVPRRHIAKLAREVSTLDQLSGGRVIFGAGAGYALLPDYAAFGDATDATQRAAKLDEGLDVLADLWSGAAVGHQGQFFNVTTDGFAPPVQRPRVPVWTAATHGASKPIARAAKWDGMICAAQYGLEVEPADLRDMVATVTKIRGETTDFDVIRFGQTAGGDDIATVAACADAGATWWMEYTFPTITTLEATRERLHAGPPRL